MRSIPNRPHRCHICAHRFTISDRFSKGKRRRLLGHIPDACPSCHAPLRFGSGKIDIGTARGLLLAVFAPESQNQFWDTCGLLRLKARTPEQVRTILDFAAALDIDDFEKSYEGRRLIRGERAEIAALPEIRAEVEAGTLRARLEEAAAPYLNALAEEIERYGA